MSIAMAGLLAGLFSAALFLVLALHDPKRLRSLRGHGGSQDRVPMLRSRRRTLAALAFLPGVALAITGWWPAWLIWLAASFSLGWTATLLLADRAGAKRGADA